MADNLRRMAGATGGLYRPIEGVRVRVVIDRVWIGDAKVFHNKTGTVLGLAQIPGTIYTYFSVRMDESFWPTNPINLPYENLVPLEGQ